MENINLNIYPVGDMPVLHVSQFDNGRICRVNLFDGEDAYTLEGNEVITCNIRKVDNNIVSLEVENTEGSYLDIEFTEQACACAGLNLCEIQISVNDEVIGTLNFYLSVEVSPLLGGVDSTTVIDDLETQIEEIAAQVIGNDYYNKTEVDGLLATKADVSDLPDMSDYYNKSAVDTLLSGKVDNATLNYYYNKSSVDNLLSSKADQSTTYNKTEVDGLLATKADISDLPDMSNYYTKSEVDNKIINIIPDNNASGSIANFNTSFVLPLVSLKINIDYNANGVNSVVLKQTGSNIWGGSQMVTDFQDAIPATVVNTTNKTLTYNASDTANRVLTQGISFKENTQYTFVITGIRTGGGGTNLYTNLRIYYTDSTYTTPAFSAKDVKETLTVVSTSGKTVNYLSKNTQSGTTTLYYDECGIFEGVISASDYNTYNANTFTIALGQTIYGGYIDYTDSKLYSTKNADGTDKETPDIYDLTDLPTISTIVGEENIFADSGDVEVSFKQDIENYVNDKTSNVGRSVNLMRIAAPTESEGDNDER